MYIYNAFVIEKKSFFNLDVIRIFFLKTIFMFDENQEILFIVYNLILIFSKNPIIRRIIIP